MCSTAKSVQLKDPDHRRALPSNIIPANQLSPNGLGILKAYPMPNSSGFINGNQNWYVAANHPEHQRKDTLAADFNPTDKQRIQFRRMNYAFFEYQPPDGGSNLTPQFFNRPNQTNSLNHVWTISPTMVNELLATVSLDDVYIPVDTANFFDRTKAGINYPYIFPTGKLIPTRIPTVNLGSFSGLNGGPYPSHSAGPIYNLSDKLTWVKGSHTLSSASSTRSPARTITTKSTSAPAPPAPTTRTASSPSRTPAPACPRPVRPSATWRWACSTPTPNSAAAPTRPSAAACAKASPAIAGRSARNCTSTTAFATP